MKLERETVLGQAADFLPPFQYDYYVFLLGYL